MLRIASLLVLALLGTLSTPAVAQAGTAAHHLFGIRLRRPAPPSAADAVRNSAAPIAYYGGPVMHSTSTYAVFWGPPNAFPAGYEASISRFLIDVAADSGKSTNVYGLTGEYSDGQGKADYRAGFAGALGDQTPYPPNACSAGGASACITIPQLEAELGRLIDARGMPAGLSPMYAVLTPPGVALCTDSSARQCSTNYFCSYHAFAPTSGADAIYAALPFATGCDVGQHPNGPVDGALDSLAHEQIETITDPYGNAWHNDADGEIADVCQSTFDAILGGTRGARYNQVIAGDHYYLQDVWSNASGRCRARYSDPPVVRAAGYRSRLLRGLRLGRRRRAISPHRGLHAWIRYFAAARGAATITLIRRRHGHVARVRMPSRAGVNRVRLRRLLGRRRLHAGSYQLVITLRTRSGERDQASLKFVVRAE